MKKKLLALIAGVGAVTASVQTMNAQGYITLDNYSSGGPAITYNGVGLDNSYTVGLYWALGDLTGTISPDPTGIGMPSDSLTLGIGGGSTVQIAGQGYFFSINPFAVPGSTPGSIATLMVVAYQGADYASALIRGHSDAFKVTLGSSTAVPAVITGDAMSAFSVQAVPEPSIFALAGMGGAALLFLRKKVA